ncbi:hypothetical protein [Hymenobacter sp. AT01-02]|uniref:hypothetical protein n=1 Tax=Hymenobacter sp. AT01-02 TaxID=1571877 RepID=UPI000B0631F9|nr:hypothetical protein [Hymenobacter sp. AT01-02]
MKTPKKALVAELTTALAPILSPTAAPAALPKSVTSAIDELAESILRWRAREARPTRTGSSLRPASSESDALARLMDTHLHEEEGSEEPVATLPVTSTPRQAPAAPVASTSPASPTPARKRRPRLGSAS